MASQHKPAIAVVDYGLGNLFSVMNACEHAGMTATITSEQKDLWNADAVVLPGVGAFGDAMAALKRVDLVSPLQDIAASGKPLIAICLGMQLLMSESAEFGTHEGLGIIPGSVLRFKNPVEPPAPGTANPRALKVPQVGWNRIFRHPGGPHDSKEGQMSPDQWTGGPFDGLEDGEFMYFVHSYYVRPDDSNVVQSYTRYGDIEFCSSLKIGNVTGFQFHPERSGAKGLKTYHNIASQVQSVSLLGTTQEE